MQHTVSAAGVESVENTLRNLGGYRRALFGRARPDIDAATGHQPANKGAARIHGTIEGKLFHWLLSVLNFMGKNISYQNRSVKPLSLSLILHQKTIKIRQSGKGWSDHKVFI